MAIDFEAKIKCSGCNKNLMPLRFSEAAKQRYWQSLRLNQQNEGMHIKRPLCQNCNVGNRQELTCCICNTTKSLEGFSKAQRKKPDDAHCLDCQQEKSDREPEHEDEVEEINIIERLRTDTLSESSMNPSVSNASYLEHLQQDQRSELNSTPSLDDWHSGYEAPSFERISSAYSTVSVMSYSSHHSARTNSSLPGAYHLRNDHAFARSGELIPSGAFVSQTAVRKSLNEKAREQIQRDERKEKDLEEQVVRDDSDDENDGNDELPY